MFLEPLTDAQLIEWNRQGLIPGPQEEEKAFVHRANYCLALRQEFSAIFEDKLPFEEEEHQAQPILEEAKPLACRHFDIYPSWTPVFFSNQKLPFWQGGCSWIFQKDETQPTAAFLQLRRPLKQQARLLKIYARPEIVSHEMAHIGRMVFEEPKFEEILAYQTSSSFFRRFLGPIVRSSRESSIFLFVLLTLMIADSYLLLAGASLQLFYTLVWLHFIPVVLIGFTLIRLMYCYRQFNKAKSCLQRVGLTPSIVSAILYRLTDQEIIETGQMHYSQWLQKARIQMQTSLRWRVIWIAYLS